MTKPTEKTQQPETGLQSFASLCVMAISVLFVYAFIAQNFLIPSASMASTILVGDHDVVDRVSLVPASCAAASPSSSTSPSSNPTAAKTFW